jgi:hypothetical protein
MPFLDCFKCHCDKQEVRLPIPPAPQIRTRMLVVKGPADTHTHQIGEIELIEEPVPPGSRMIVVMSNSPMTTIYRGS